MLVKHVVVIGMIALGVVLDFLAREIGVLADAGRAVAVHRVSRAAQALTGLGALVLLLTAAAQAS